MRRRFAGVVAVLVAVASLGAVTAGPPPPPDRRPNVVVIITDDQSAETIPHDPPVMPWLETRLRDPDDHWVAFPNAMAESPMCCPSRATILTGLTATHTGVLTNADGSRFDDRETIATALHDAGYVTGLVGKYLNGYPFARPPEVPPGWDRWVARRQSADLYYDYTLEEEGVAVRYGSGPSHYQTDVLAERAVGFIHSVPEGRPFFLLFSPSAPHRPSTPAPRHAGAAVPAPDVPPSVGEEDVSDKPAWVRALPSLDAADRAALASQREAQYRALLAVDEAVRAIVEALRERGELDRTLILYLSDNGASFGEHRWTMKVCPYAACARIPFLARLPGATPGFDPTLVSTVDVAPTIADLAGVSLPGTDGASLVPALDGTGAVRRPGVLMEWAGGNGVPAWRAVRTPAFLYVELSTGERELYDLAGRLGPPDPYELEDRSGQPAYAEVKRRLRGLLGG